MPVLSRIAEESPEGLFFPVFPGEGAHIARQAGQVEGLAELVLIGSDSLLLAARRWWLSMWLRLSCVSRAM